MATIKEQILDALHADLQGITVTNGYDVGFSTVRRAVELPTGFRLYPACMYSVTANTAAHLSVSRVRRTMTVVIAGIGKMHNRSTDDDKSTTATGMLGAIQKAVLSDLIRGGLAIDTREGSSDVSWLPTDPFVTAMATFEIDYYTALTDPSSQTA